MDVELVELGQGAPPRRGPGPRPLFAVVVLVLVALIGLLGFSTDGNDGPAASPDLPEASTLVADSTTSPATPYPWAWAEVELSGFGRGATVENLWVVGDRFVAEIETDEGPDGGPYGPVSSVLVASSDGLTWSDVDIDLPAEAFVVVAGTVADGRLWVLGHTGARDAPHWQLWSTENGSWRQEADPKGLVEGPARVTALAYQGACLPDTGCAAPGWVAVVNEATSSPAPLRTSADGRSWQSAEVAGEPGLLVIGLAFHGGRWFAAASRGGPGSATLALTSDDRIRWSADIVSSGASSGRAIAAGFAGVAIVGTEEVQGDHRPRVWRSTDGVDWLRFDGEVPFGRAPAPMDLVTATTRGYLAITAADGDAWFSSDGRSWLDYPAFDPGTGNAVRLVAAAGDVVVAAGRSGAGRPAFWRTSLSELAST